MTNVEQPEAGVKRRLGRPPTLNRDAALKAARGVIAVRGFDRTRYSDVADASGIPVTTLQHAFGSLKAMLLESVQKSAASEIAVLRDLSHGAELTPWERLSSFIEGAVHPPDEPDSWLLWLELWRLAGRDPEMGADAGVIYAHWYDYVEELIVLGREAGQFSGPFADTPRDGAVACVSIIDGLAVSLVVRADGPDYDRLLDLSLRTVANLLGKRD
ncbi:MAG: TetR/AcrR family transcriptional regulator [Solirubrobacteraceae bacterium]|nr:TetR/AcrR family transcriptional regulator [Solirubrobacteraceae bacterium]